MHKAAIIGYGKMGKIRKKAIDLIPGCSVGWVCDVNRAEGDFNYTDNPGVIFEDREIDMVFICTPNYLIKDLVVRGLDAQKHVFCEKPPGISSGQVLDIIGAEQRNPGCKLMIGFNHRRHQSIREAKELVDSGKFGKILWLRGRYGKSVDQNFYSTWRARKDMAGSGILMDQGIHMLDLFLMFCGQFEEVKSFCSNLYWQLDVEDNVFAIFRNKKGQVASLHSTMTQWRNLFSLEVFMEKGYITINGLNTPSQTYGKEQMTVAENRTKAPQAVWTEERRITYFVDDSFNSEVSDFIRCIDNDKSIGTGNSQDALKVLQLVERIYQNGSN